MSTDEILKKADAISLNAAALADNNTFCRMWPAAKQGLEMLEKVLKDPTLVLIIEAIVTTGDAVRSRVCK